MLVEDSDNFSSFSSTDRQEFLFRLFTHLVVGGNLNQYDDSIAAYFDLTKSLYKDLVTVSKVKIAYNWNIYIYIYIYIYKEYNPIKP